jgi:hypothetical protein
MLWHCIAPVLSSKMFKTNSSDDLKWKLFVFRRLLPMTFIGTRQHDTSSSKWSKIQTVFFRTSRIVFQSSQEHSWPLCRCTCELKRLKWANDWFQQLARGMNLFLLSVIATESWKDRLGISSLPSFQRSLSKHILRYFLEWSSIWKVSGHRSVC